MNDFGGVAGKTLSDGVVFFFDQLKDFRKFSYSFFRGRHERVAAGDRRYLRDPAVGLVPVNYELVVVEAHATIVGQDCEGVTRTTSELPALCPPGRRNPGSGRAPRPQ